MLFYHKDVWVCQRLLSIATYDRKATILRVKIWSKHQSDVVGLMALNKYLELTRRNKNLLSLRYLHFPVALLA
jgi:hypothetical protein